MFIINNEHKPNAKYRIILSTEKTYDASQGIQTALQLLEDKINKLAEDSITSNRELAVTLIGSPSILVIPDRAHATEYNITASQTVLIEVIETE